MRLPWTLVPPRFDSPTVFAINEVFDKSDLVTIDRKEGAARARIYCALRAVLSCATALR